MWHEPHSLVRQQRPWDWQLIWHQSNLSFSAFSDNKYPRTTSIWHQSNISLSVYSDNKYPQIDINLTSIQHKPQCLLRQQIPSYQHRSNTKVSDQCLIKFIWRIFAIISGFMTATAVYRVLFWQPSFDQYEADTMPSIQMIQGMIQSKGSVDSRFAPSQWEMALQSNAVSHWLGANLESALILVD